MDNDRLKHILGVANKMVKIGKQLNLGNEQLDELFLLGFNHDVGYGLNDDFFNHGIIGGEKLKKSGYKYWKEVYYHGKVDVEYSSIYLDILNMADMQVNKYGCDVGYDERLNDIKSRYGIDAIPYKNSKKLISKLKNKYEYLDI